MEYAEIEKIAQAIKTMRIRGAGNIGRATARALKIFAMKSRAETGEEFMEELRSVSKLLLETRPTAVSLSNAIRFVTSKAKLGEGKDVKALKKIVISRADEFIRNSKQAVKRIGEIGSRRISDGDVILTHCNSSCALSVIKTAFREGKRIEVYVTESRPARQGLISARELLREGIPTTLIVDSAVRHIIRDIDKVIVGADSIAANGAVINKIGTSQIALAAHEARVLFFVAAESYKFHPGTLVGRLVEIEERDPSEVVNPKRFPNLKIRNPVFDVTPPEYIDLIITERGIIPPSAAYTILQEQLWGTEEEIY
jgi:ribose 1,5-bisphosphate isomerase